MLGSQPSSNRSIEIQLMRRFNQDSFAYNLQYPVEFYENFAELCDLSPKVTGSLLSTEAYGSSMSYKLSSCTIHAFSNDDVQMIKQILISLLQLSSPVVNNVYRKYKSAILKNITFQCSTPKHLSIAYAKWDEELFGTPPTFFTNLTD